MDLNSDVPVKVEPGACDEEEEDLHTEIDIDESDLKEDCFVQYVENNRSAGGERKVMMPLKRNEGPRESMHQNLSNQTSRMNSLPSTTHVSKKTRSNQRQMNFLIDFMMNHPEFAAGRYFGAQGPQTNRALWKKLAEQLAEIGPAKSVEQLKTTWRDLKCKTRAEAKRASLRTDNAANIPDLTDQRRKVINILDRTEGSGVAESSAWEGNEDLVLEVEYNQPSTSHSPTSRRLSDPAVQYISCSGSDSGRTRPTEKRKRKRSPSPELAGDQMENALESGDGQYSQLVKAVNRIGDILERFTTAFVENMEMRRNRKKSRRPPANDEGLAAYSSSDTDE